MVYWPLFLLVLLTSDAVPFNEDPPTNAEQAAEWLRGQLAGGRREAGGLAVFKNHENIVPDVDPHDKLYYGWIPPRPGSAAWRSVVETDGRGKPTGR